MSCLWRLPQLDRKIKYQLVRTLILSRLDYNIAVLNGVTKKEIHSYNVVYKNAIRWIFNVRKYDHISEYIIKSHILPPSYRLLFSCTVWVHKCLMEEVPNYLLSLVHEKVFCRDTRISRKGKLCEPSIYRNKFSKRRLSYS